MVLPRFVYQIFVARIAFCEAQVQRQAEVKVLPRLRAPDFRHTRWSSLLSLNDAATSVFFGARGTSEGLVRKRTQAHLGVTQMHCQVIA